MENLVYPWRNANWPQLKMTYNYQINGTLSGIMVTEDSAYSYSKDGGMKKPELVEKPFEYFTEVKVDSKGNRSVQSVWVDSTKSDLIEKIVLDFDNARMYHIDGET